MELISSVPLRLEEGTSDLHTLEIHPDQAREIDLPGDDSTFQLYTRMNEFINSTGRAIQVRLREKVDCEPGVLRIRKQLREKLGNPGQVKFYRKDNHLFLKPLPADG